MKIQIRSNVINGKLNRNRNLLIDAIQSFEGKEISITIEKAKKQRSNQQNRFYYGCILPIVKSCLKEAGHILNDESVHDLIKLKFLKETLFINEATGEVVERIKSTTELSTSQFMDFLAEINNFTQEYFNVTLPSPNDDLTLNFNE
jgi:hypothetical protein